MFVRRKAFFGAVALAAFITVCVYGLDSALPIWLYAIIFAISAYAIFAFTGKMSAPEGPPAAPLNKILDTTDEP